MTFSSISYRVLQKLLNEHYFLYEYFLHETFNQSLTDFQSINCYIVYRVYIMDNYESSGLSKHSEIFHKLVNMTYTVFL